MFVKNTLEEEVSIVVKLCGAVWRDLYSAIRGQTETIIEQKALTHSLRITVPHISDISFKSDNGRNNLPESFKVM